MSQDRSHTRPNARRAEMVAAYLEHREDELLDAVVSTAALVARADGWIQKVERTQLLDFVDREELLSVFPREDTMAHFEHCVRRLREPDGPLAVIRRLGRHSDSPTASFIINIGEEVAAADRHLDPREEQVLQDIRTALEGRTP